ncbi:hypothetical protein GCM10027157_13940 [Corynebacterium aquatimens]
MSVRGRRVVASTETKRKFSVLSFVALPLLVLGIFGAMLLSALSTQQTFTLEQLKAEERTLSNEIESLNRSVEEAKSSANIALRADKANMTVPGQPGILAVGPDGKVKETGEADPAKKYRVIDVNAETIRTDRATSDRDATRDVADSLAALPQVAGAQFAATPGPAGAAAPAPGPAPAQRPADVPAQPPANAPAQREEAPRPAEQAEPAAERAPR